MSSELPWPAVPEWLRRKPSGVDWPPDTASAWARTTTRNRRTSTSSASARIIARNNRIPTSTDQSPPPESSTIKRLQSELKDLMMSDWDSSGISAFPEKETIMLWRGSITGGEGSVFEGKQYKLSLHFPNDYPFKPPVVIFDRPAPFHPNVDYLLGKVYLNILLQEWSSGYDVRTVLLSIKTLLEDPNLSAPVNPYAAKLWSNQKEYRIAEP